VCVCCPPASWVIFSMYITIYIEDVVHMPIYVGCTPASWLYFGVYITAFLCIYTCLGAYIYDVCWRMLTCADVCWRMLTYAKPGVYYCVPMHIHMLRCVYIMLLLCMYTWSLVAWPISFFFPCAAPAN
jgi:hypothetical protein